MSTAIDDQEIGDAVAIKIAGADILQPALSHGDRGLAECSIAISQKDVHAGLARERRDVADAVAIVISYGNVLPRESLNGGCVGDLHRSFECAVTVARKNVHAVICAVGECNVGEASSVE